jgi:hypothetical protein
MRMKTFLITYTVGSHWWGNTTASKIEMDHLFELWFIIKSKFIWKTELKSDSEEIAKSNFYRDHPFAQLISISIKSE